MQTMRTHQGGWLYMQIALRPYQQAAVDAVYEHLRARDDNPCVVLPTGCHAKGHSILMYDGSVKKVEDIVVGDLLMGPDSKPRRVLQLVRGHEPMAEVRPIKGEPFIVNENHILSLVSTNEGKGMYPSQQRGGEITNISVIDYIGKSKSWKHLRKLYRVPVEFPNAPHLIVPPYILGLLLGDGGVTKGINYTTADPELAEVFKEYVESQGCRIRVTSNGSKALTYHAVKSKGVANPITNAFRQLELCGCTSLDKFIPQMYLTAGRKERLELLAGLCDTDGYYTGICLEYVTQSKGLAEDIVFLARSLGFGVTSHEKFCRCQTGQGDWYYRIFISGDFSVIPFRRNCHVPMQRRQKKDVLRTGFKVELLPDDDFYGFALDGDHLYVDGNFIVHHNCGKSLVLGKIASDAVNLWHGRVLILAHVKELLEQNADKVRKLCPDLKVGIYSAGLKSRDTKEDIIVAGIQSVYDKADKLGAFDLVLADECHLWNSDNDESMYKSFWKDMKLMNPNVRLIGLTATPFRLKGGAICKPENLLNHICYEAGLKEMIAQGYLSTIVSRAGHAEADLSSVHTRAGEFVQDELASVMDEEALVNASCEEIVRLTKDRKSVLIFCTSVEHCKHVAERIQYYSHQECAIVTGSTPSAERAEIIARFRGEKIPADLWGTPKPPLKFLANCAVLCLAEDTEILTSKGFVGIDEMSFEHQLAAWKSDGTIEFSAPRNIIIREREPGEKMISCDVGLVPRYRVTESHRMVIACGAERKKHKVASASELVGKAHKVPAGGIAVPFDMRPQAPGAQNVAGRVRSNSYSYRKKGIPPLIARRMADELVARQRNMKYKMPFELTITECEFIGFWVGDGTAYGGRYSITQSLRYPAIVEWIEEHIEEMGIHTTEHIIRRTGKMNNDAVNWAFPKGTGGDGQYVPNGIFPYLPYLKKGWNDLLFAFSKEQFEAFLYGLWLADGHHTADLKAKTFSVASTDYDLYNCLQAVGAMRGLSTVLRKCALPKKPHHVQQWYFRWSKKTHYSFLKTSAKFENEYRKERVWCVESTTGFIICRRGGKTFVTGNCTGFDAPNTDCVVMMRPTQSPGLLLQIAGRGLRLSPDTGKQNCIFLDYGSNIMRHGPLDMIKVKEPGAGGHGDAPVKKCPQCSALIAAGYGKCPECGYEFPPPERSNLTEHASNEGVLSGEIRDEEYDVRSVFYEPHAKRNADENTPRTMRVDYETGIGQYKSEWVCPEHKGYARGKFEKWWRERACPDCPIPNTVDEAVSWARAGALATPTHITVRWVTGEKFDRITKAVCGEKPEMNDELMFLLENGPLPTTPASTEIINDDDLPF